MKYALFILLTFTFTTFAQTGDGELVNIKEFIPDIVLDLKYNTLDNFIARFGPAQKLYTTDECFVARNTAERLIIIQDSLKKITQHDGKNYPQGLGLKIWDGYRPQSVSALMYELVGQPWTALRSNHNRGAAVDVTLVDMASGEELPMPTYFDAFNDTAKHTFNDLPPNIIANRQLLKNMMEQIGGFGAYSEEWWHYSYGPATSNPYWEFQLK
jgi:D-alanyl-D-alanine dipeptidase